MTTSIDSDEGVSGQRRWAAILFADISGSTELAQELGDEPFYGLMRDLMGECWSIVERNYGHTVEFGGDSVLAIFGAPVAVENASLNACKAALQMQEFASSATDRFTRAYGKAPQIRIGISGGIVTVGDLSINSKMKLNVLGGPVNMASRLENIAAPGEVLFSSKIADEVANLVQARPLGAKSLKGFAEPEQVYQLNGISTSDTTFKMRLRRGSKRFVGRDEELQRLLSWAQRDAAAPKLLNVVGPAGIGKSRLMFELNSALDGSVTLLTGACDIGRRANSYGPLIGLIRDYVGWSTEAPREQLLDLLAAKFGSEVAESEALVDLIAGVSAGGDDADRENAIQIRGRLAEILTILSEDKSLALVIEDAHWLDPTSADLLREMACADQLRATITYRPGGQFATDLEAVKTLNLHALEKRQLSEVIASVLGVTEVPVELTEFVETASDGLPLFTEEVVQFLRNDGQIVIDGDTVTFLPKDGALLEAGNLQNLVLSLFDSLSAPAQRCLELAAAKGRRFNAAFLERAIGNPDEVLSVIDEVTNHGIVEADPQGGRRGLRFSHVLFADSIYQAVLKSERQRLHLRVANALAQDESQSAAELAHHFERGGDPAKAVQYYGSSARNAMSVYAVDIADRQLERAFRLIEADPATIDDTRYGALLMLHCHALDVFGNFRRLNEIVQARLPRLLSAGPSPDLVICLTLQALSRCHGGEYQRAKELIDQAAALSDRIADETSATWVKVAKMRIYSDTETATNAEIEDLYACVRPVADRLGNRYLIQASIYNLQASYRSIGKMKKAEAMIRELEAFGRNRNDSRAVAYAHWAKAVHCFTKRDAVALHAATQTVLEHAIPGTADWRVASVYQLAEGLLSSEPGPDPDLFTPHMDKTREFEDFTLHHTTWVGRMLACFKTGQFARARREMEAMRTDFAKSATNELQRVLLIYQSEILLSVAGLKKSAGPPPKLGPRDLLVFLQMRVFARRKADRMFRQYLEKTPAQVGPLVAQAHFGLGLIAKSRNKLGRAREHLEMAQKLYADEGYATAAAQVGAAMST